MKIVYSVENDYFEYYQIDISDIGFISEYIFAEEIAEDYYWNHDGWETNPPENWPLKFHYWIAREDWTIDEDVYKEIYVNIEVIPTFSLLRVK
jgi:hypothetical protein